MSLEALFKQYPLYSAMFDEQLQFALSPSQYKAALCSRRAGKTKGIILEIIQDALTFPRSLILYLALTDDSVKKITYPVILEIMEQFKLPAELMGDGLMFANGSQICCLGANQGKKIENFRGTKLRDCVIDEAASFGEAILTELIDKIIDPALSDLRGKLILAGTPAAHCTGAFFNATTGLEVGWDVHKWLGFDNPFASAQQHERAAQYLKRKKVDETDAGYRREYLGEWCTDEDSLMIKPFSITKLPKPYEIDSWRSVVGVDFGYNDKTAFTVIAWQKFNPKAYIVESYGISAPNVSDIEKHLKRIVETYKPLIIVGDPAGASKIMISEFNTRNIFMKSAQKSEKAHYVEILNDALINQELVLVPDNTEQLQYEFKKVVWNEQRTREHENTKECDCMDSALYAFRECLAYIEKIPTKVERTPELFEKELLDAKLKYVESLHKPKVDWQLDTDYLNIDY